MAKEFLSSIAALPDSIHIFYGGSYHARTNQDEEDASDSIRCNTPLGCRIKENITESCSVFLSLLGGMSNCMILDFKGEVVEPPCRLADSSILTSSSGQLAKLEGEPWSYEYNVGLVSPAPIYQTRKNFSIET